MAGRELLAGTMLYGDTNAILMGIVYIQSNQQDSGANYGVAILNLVFLIIVQVPEIYGVVTCTPISAEVCATDPYYFLPPFLL